MAIKQPKGSNILVGFHGKDFPGSGRGKEGFNTNPRKPENVAGDTPGQARPSTFEPVARRQPATRFIGRAAIASGEIRHVASKALKPNAWAALPNPRQTEKS